MVVVQKLKVSWTKIGQQIEELKHKVSQLPIKFSRVVGVSRGGLILSVALSHKLNIPLSIVGVSSYNNETHEQETLICDTPDIIFKGWKGNILVCDDLTDSGKTFDFLLRKMKSYSTITGITTITFYHKEQSIVKPDIFLETTDKWVVFAWESE